MIRLSYLDLNSMFLLLGILSIAVGILAIWDMKKLSIVSIGLGVGLLVLFVVKPTSPSVSQVQQALDDAGYNVHVQSKVIAKYDRYVFDARVHDAMKSCVLLPTTKDKIYTIVCDGSEPDKK